MRKLLKIRVRLVSALCIFAIVLSAATAFGVYRHRQLIDNVRYRFQLHVGAHPLIAGGQLVGQYDPAFFCDEAAYEGPETLLYSNRPYHTATDIKELEGAHFCRSSRHAETYSLVNVDQQTTIYTIGVKEMRLEFIGWELVPQEVFIKADGVSFNKMYRKDFSPGRYILNHAFWKTSVPVFWNPKYVKVIH